MVRVKVALMRRAYSDYSKPVFLITEILFWQFKKENVYLKAYIQTNILVYSLWILHVHFSFSFDTQRNTTRFSRVANQLVITRKLYLGHPNQRY